MLEILEDNLLSHLARKSSVRILYACEDTGMVGQYEGPNVPRPLSAVLQTQSISSIKVIHCGTLPRAHLASALHADTSTKQAMS